MITTIFDYANARFAVSDELLSKSAPFVKNACRQVIDENGKGADFLGWKELPVSYSPEDLEVIKQQAAKLRKMSQVVVVIGIGGSYLGARAVIEALQNGFKMQGLAKDDTNPQMIFAGNNMCEDYLADMMELLDCTDYSVIVISKSGTTTEPAIAFRIIKKHCEDKYGKQAAKERIVAITDKEKGALKLLSDREGYASFVIPNNVGGRYSVLSPVGLLPIAVAGYRIDDLLAGAASMRKVLLQQEELKDNIAMQYALIRYLLYAGNKNVELMVAYETNLFFFIEWYKQLFGESEGKDGKGIFPAGAVFSTDLHSLGQYIQQGERLLFETVLSVKNVRHHLPIPYDNDNVDGLNYLQMRSIHDINRIAENGTVMAHVEGNVPVLRIEIPTVNETSLGELIFFFEMSCAIGGYLLDVNPFDQPGVEAYKKNMFRLLGKK